jgi:hypothetical protein
MPCFKFFDCPLLFIILIGNLCRAPPYRLDGSSRICSCCCDGEPYSKGPVLLGEPYGGKNGRKTGVLLSPWTLAETIFLRSGQRYRILLQGGAGFEEMIRKKILKSGGVLSGLSDALVVLAASTFFVRLSL